MKTIRLHPMSIRTLAAIALICLPASAHAITPAEQAGMAPGSVHKVGVGLGVAKFRVIRIGDNGWVMVECQEDNNAGWRAGEKYWLNTNAVAFISAPFKTAAEPEGQPAKRAVKPG
jgi:hypothetical protein